MSLAEIEEGAVQVKRTTHDKPLMGGCVMLVVCDCSGGTWGEGKGMR